MATKQLSRYPSTKFHKQAKSTFASEIYGTVHKPQTPFFLHLSELSTAIQDNYPQKKPVKSKKNRLKFSKKQKKNQIQDIRILKLLISLFINFTSFFSSHFDKTYV